MCINLTAEMARRGVTTADLGTATGKTTRSMQDKIAGRYPFTYPEAKAIRDTYFMGMALEYLFAESDQDSA